MLFQKDINPESFLAIGTQKVLPDIEASIGYASGNKLNGFQLEQLEKNLITMKESLSPTNVVEMGGGGIDSLRAKSGLGERQLTEAAAGERPINLSGELTSIADEPGQAGLSYAIKNPANITEAASDIKSIDDAAAGVNAADAAADTSPLMSRLENRIGGMRDETEAATGIMATVEKGDLPAKTGAAREFLINSLKVGDDYPSTTLTDVMSAEDMKYIFEGGGGAMGDPLVLVQKYFGPRIAEMIPNGGSSEEIAIFTKRVMENVEDAKGLKPDEQGFDTMTARFIDEFTPPEGGQPFAKGGLAKILEL
jgi:hypothetical protein